ncbi:MAG: hypothetical protein AAFQ82_17075 [Myxococcota bacterium]
MTADNENKNSPQPAAEAPLLTRDFGRSLVDPDRQESASEPGTIQVRISPFVYSAWGFGVLMPKGSREEANQTYSLA